MELDGLATTYAYKLNKFKIWASDGKNVDFRDQILEFDLYEDLFSPCMTATARVYDAADHLSKFKLHGNEFVELELDKPSLDKPISKIFRIYKISNRVLGTSFENYTIHMCSEEMILSPQISLSLSYKGMDVTTMVRNILIDHLKVDPDKIARITKTQGVYDVIIPKLDPLEAILWLGGRAYSSTGSAHFFFENRDGYNFVSYEELLKAAPYAKYYRHAKITPDPSKNAYTFTELKVIEDFDLMKATRYGSFSSSLNILDIITKNFNTYSFNAIYFKSKGILNKEVTLNGLMNRFGKTFYSSYNNMQKYVVVKDSDPTVGNPMTPENWLCEVASKLGQIHLYKMIGTVPGDVMLTVGAVIEVEMQAMTPQDQKNGAATGTNNLNSVRTGKYLVSKVHHKLLGDTFTTSVELLSDSINEFMPPPLNNNADMSRLIKS